MSKYKKPELDGHWQLVDLVYRNSGLRGNARLVAWSLAQKYYPKKGYSAYPVRQIAEDAGLSTKTILAALREIEESGEWNTVKKPGAATRFYPNMQKLTVKQPTFKKASSDDTTWVERLTQDSSKKKDSSAASSEPDDNVPSAKEPEKTKKNIASQEEPTPPVLPEVVAPADTQEESIDEEPAGNVQKVLPDEDWNIFDNPGDILRPSMLKSPRSCATRLHKRTPLETRKNKDDFTIESLTRLYTRLSEKYPLHAVDALLWIQCELSQPLNDKFLGLVLSKCTAGGQIVAPVKSKNTPADKTAMKVWMLHQARNWKPETEKKKRYQEAL